MTYLDSSLEVLRWSILITGHRRSVGAAETQDTITLNRNPDKVLLLVGDSIRKETQWNDQGALYISLGVLSSHAHGIVWVPKLLLHFFNCKINSVDRLFTVIGPLCECKDILTTFWIFFFHFWTYLYVQVDLICISSILLNDPWIDIDVCPR